MNNLYLKYNNNKRILSNSKYSYYKAFYNAKKEEIEQNKKLQQNININEEEKDMLIKDTMEVKNDETIYKLEIEKFNKELDTVEDEYIKIKNKMEFAEQSRIVRLPLNQVGSLNKINHEINKFEQENQRHPSVSELSDATKLDEEKIGQSLMADGHHVSIDAPFQDGEDNCMLDVMASGDDSRTDRQVDHESMALELNSVLNKVLKEREITIIRECFGIGCHEKGLEEIGDQLGLTRERVRQIREKSIAKLRDSGNAKILMKYLG